MAARHAVIVRSGFLALIAVGCGGGAAGEPNASNPVATTSEGSEAQVPRRSSLRIDPSLSMVPLTVDAELGAAEHVEFVLHSRTPERALELLKPRYPAVRTLATGTVSVVPSRAESSPAHEPEPRHREASFVIDFDQPSVEALAVEARRRLGERPDPAALRDFVRGHFEKTQYGGFDIASRVATTRRGDCTEHAVLLTALARRFAMPARVVFGIVALVGEAPFAFHHAWTEIHHEGEWRSFDAALPTASARGYLALAELTNEGPGFGVGLPMANVLLALEHIELRPARP